MLTKKDALEYNYWATTKYAEYHRAKLGLYLWAFGHYDQPQSVLEIGCGPYGGVLPMIARAPRRVGVDPLANEYRKLGQLPDGIDFVAAHFEEWPCAETFDAIFAIDALDHGEMGLQLLPKIAELLTPRGRFYLHLHFRPAHRLNEIHNHSMSEADLRHNLEVARLKPLSGTWYSDDVDGTFECRTLVGVYERC